MSETPAIDSRPLLTDLSRTQLQNWCRDHSLPEYRADQIRQWIFGKRIHLFEEMRDIPNSVRVQLASEFDLWAGRIVRHQTAIDRTEKLLLELRQGDLVECVLMRETDRATICVSTQVGCGMGCVFCASGLEGVKRNLSTGEILEQILRVDRLLGPEERVTNIVVMGMGEPLANLKQLLPALDTLNDKGGMGLGARRITISTVGLPEKMRELAQHTHPYNLAVSLHAPDDLLRTEIVPTNRGTGIAAILQAADEYFAATGRRVTYEYVLLAGRNDGPDQAKQLAKLLRGRIAHVNLIPMNPVAPIDLTAPAEPRTQMFAEMLEHGGINVTVRKRKGADIDAACGQLRLTELTRSRD